MVRSKPYKKNDKPALGLGNSNDAVIQFSQIAI